MKPRLFARLIVTLFMIGGITGLFGCHVSPAKKANTNFFTSGSREADQRASQRMAQAEQLDGSGEGEGEKGVKKAKVKNLAMLKRRRPPEIQIRLHKPRTNWHSMTGSGGQPGISNLVADFTKRALDDPRVNWNRQGVTRGGFSLRKSKSETWNPTPESVAQLQKHIAEFLALATGGPAEYSGKPIESAHADMHISNPEFDAAVGDLKASLDRLKIPNKEQKELLAIVESTRPQIVTKR